MPQASDGVLVTTVITFCEGAFRGIQLFRMSGFCQHHCEQFGKTSLEILANQHDTLIKQRLVTETVGL